MLRAGNCKSDLHLEIPHLRNDGVPEAFVVAQSTSSMQGHRDSAVD
jgi:hypothetical protein